MPPSTLPSNVHLGDLILVYTSDRADILLVKSVTDEDDPSPSTSSITVQNLSCHIPAQTGYWILSGPDVYHVTEGSAWNHEYCISNGCEYEDEYENRGGNSDDDGEDDSDNDDEDYGHYDKLDYVLSSLVSPWRVPDGQQEDVTVLVRPHGRDVLKHYFNNSCPICGTLTWICPGCADGRERFPELRNHCSTDQACPVCMGYDFALNDRAMLSEIDELEFRLRQYRRRDKKDISAEELQELKDEVLEAVRKRYELTLERKREMGIPLEDLDEMMADWKEYWYDVDE